MRALFVQHDHVSPVGPIGARLAERGYDVEELVVVPEDSFDRPGVAWSSPTPPGYDVIVPMGAPWSVYDHDLIGAWAVPEMTFLREGAHEAGVPVLGICFGGQALAAALGGAVVPSTEVEIGWHTVETDEPGLVEAGPWFQWHHDRWEAPAGSPHRRPHRARRPGVRARSQPGRPVPPGAHALDAGGLARPTAARRTSRRTGSTSTCCSTGPTREAAAAEGRAHRLVDRFLDQVAHRDVVAVTGLPETSS